MLVNNQRITICTSWRKAFAAIANVLSGHRRLIICEKVLDVIIECADYQFLASNALCFTFENLEWKGGKGCSFEDP